MPTGAAGSSPGFAITDLVARRIAAYWLAKPEGSDTAKGIGDWWLGGMGDTPMNELRVLEALRGLVEQGVAVQAPGGLGQPTCYRLAIAQDELARRLARRRPGATEAA